MKSQFCVYFSFQVTQPNIRATFSESSTRTRFQFPPRNIQKANPFQSCLHFYLFTWKRPSFLEQSYNLYCLLFWRMITWAGRRWWLDSTISRRAETRQKNLSLSTRYRSLIHLESRRDETRRDETNIFRDNTTAFAVFMKERASTESSGFTRKLHSCWNEPAKYV